MKNILFFLLFITLLFSACEKEEESPNPIFNYTFSCNIDGISFNDNSPDVILENSTDILTINSENGGNTIRIIIYNFSDRMVDQQILLNSLTDKAYVTLDGVNYTNTQSGQIIFSKLDSKLSGTFNFTSQSSNFSIKSVTEGVFEDLSY